MRYDFTIHTYGCKVNTYDTGLLQKRLESVGHQSVAPTVVAAPPAGGETASGDRELSPLKFFGLGDRVPRVHILNTCAVTAEATKDAARTVRRLKAKDPFSTVIVTGCGAQVDGETFDVLPGADLVIANSHKGQLERLMDQYFKGEIGGAAGSKVFRSNIFRKDDLEAGGGIEAGHTRAFLKIQDGCNSFCTYCVIPFARGKSRSIPVKDLITRIRELLTSGVREIVLTGVHIGDYEDTQLGCKIGLEELVREVLRQTTVPRLRLSSLEPVELTDGVLALYDDPRMCPHFHMSIQSANTRVLKAMRRQYDAGHVEDALTRIHARLPHAFVGMDVIAGFPGETDDEFADTFDRLARLPWTRLHVFPYSERPGTKAVKLEDSVPRELRTLRSARLRELSTARFDEIARRQVGLVKDAMILKTTGQGADGLSRDYWPLKFRGRDGGDLSSDELHLLAHASGRELRARVLDYDHQNASRIDGFLTACLETADDRACEVAL